MAFVRKKRVNGREYYQLVENYREDGKVRQRMLVHLGPYPTVEAAIEAHEQGAEYKRGLAGEYQARATAALEDYRQYRAYFRERWPDEPDLGGPDMPRRPFRYEQSGREWRYWRAADTAAQLTGEAEAHERKLSALRALMASGKAKPDPPEVREQREHDRQERERKLRKTQEAIQQGEASLAAPRGRA